jgi:hypothetical protein
MFLFLFHLLVALLLLFGGKKLNNDQKMRDKNWTVSHIFEISITNLIRVKKVMCG